MTVREMLESRERAALRPGAALSSQTRGRERRLAPCDIRTEYQRDRDRILHCKSFRRLKHKTQCFVAPEGDHYRTRLTHTLEVAQIARTIARALLLNEDLAEAIALGHDLGHTPFGHMGERTLARLSGRFLHNEQSLRVVTLLEGGHGLNLTWEVRDGILNHTKEGRPATLEGQAVSLADRIAYINHDIDDALRAGVLKPGDIPSDVTEALGESHGARIDAMIKDTVLHSQDKDSVAMSDYVGGLTEKLRDFMFEAVYRRPLAVREEKRADLMLSCLYEYYRGDVTHLPPELWHIWKDEGPDAAVCDLIAGMTDRYALRVFEEMYLPTSAI